MTDAELVVDTSALVAILFAEPDATMFARALVASAGAVSVSAPTLVETSIVVEARLGTAGVDLLKALLERVSTRVVPFDGEMSLVAFQAWRRFGKGRHPAQLNLGDCFSYALAKSLGVPLLFKGRDFLQTDVRSALA